MKVFPAFFISITFLFSSGASALPADQCAAAVTSSNEVQVKVGSRQIDIIGWVHLDNEDIDVLREGFNAAIRSLEKNECFLVKNALAAALTKKNQDLKEAQHVFKKLETLHIKKPLSFVGLELAPSELTTNFTALRSITEGLRAMQLRCGLMIAPETSSYAVLLPGPEYAFNNAYQGMVTLRALEDEQAKDSSRRALASKQSTQKIMGGMGARNKAMVKNALAQEGNGAIVVGKLHVADMVQEMVRQCKAL